MLKVSLTSLLNSTIVRTQNIGSVTYAEFGCCTRPLVLQYLNASRLDPNCMLITIDQFLSILQVNQNFINLSVFHTKFARQIGYDDRLSMMNTAHIVEFAKYA